MLDVLSAVLASKKRQRSTERVWTNENEVRLGVWVGPKWVNGVSENTFKLFQRFCEKRDEPPVESCVELGWVPPSGNGDTSTERRGVSARCITMNGSRSWQLKEKLKVENHITKLLIPYRLSIAREYQYKSGKRPKFFVNEGVRRNRTRYSKRFDKNFRLDCTIVFDGTEVTYEVEIEFGTTEIAIVESFIDNVMSGFPPFTVFSTDSKMKERYYLLLQTERFAGVMPMTKTQSDVDNSMETLLKSQKADGERVLVYVDVRVSIQIQTKEQQRSSAPPSQSGSKFNEELRQRWRKMLTLSERGATEGERSAASRNLERDMKKHGASENDIGGDDEENDGVLEERTKLVDESSFAITRNFQYIPLDDVIDKKSLDKSQLHVFDAELMPDGSLIVFDVLILHNLDKRNKPFSERLEALNSVKFASNVLIKEWVEINCDHFDHPIENDGFIYVGESWAYDMQPWKVKKSNTIDVAYSFRNGEHCVRVLGKIWMLKGDEYDLNLLRFLSERRRDRRLIVEVSVQDGKEACFEKVRWSKQSPNRDETISCILFPNENPV